MNPPHPSSVPDPAFGHQLIQELVAIDSVSGQEATASRYLVGQFSALGYDQAFLDTVNNAVGIRGSQDARLTIMLLGHIDTVPGKIPVRVEDGKLYGRGSVDAKGPLATFALAAARVPLPDQVRLVVVGAVEEESATSKGARQVAVDYQPDFCVIGEPSGAGGITLGYKGRVLIDGKVQVAMGHSAGPDRSAAELMTQFWQELQGYCGQFNTPRQRLFDQLLPSLRSINSSQDGLLSTAECKVGVRLPPDFDIQQFQTCLTQLAQKAGPLQLRVHGHEMAHQSDRSNLLCRSLAAAIRQQGMRPTYKLKTGTADMNVVAPLWKCPMLAYGPGDSSLDHTPQEHLQLAEFDQAIQILADALTRLTTALQDRRQP